MTRDEFAATIKAKYPSYEGVDNETLVTRILEKHPVYASKIDAPTPEQPKFDEIEKQPGLPQGTLGMLKQFGSQAKEAIASPVPGSMLQMPVKAAQEVASQAGADVARGVKDKLGTMGARLAGFGTSMALDPTSYAGGAVGKVAGVAISKKVTPSIFKTLANVPEAATELMNKTKGLFKKATGSTEAIEAATRNVQNALKSTLAEEGKALGAVEKKLGLSKSVGDIRQEILKGTGDGAYMEQLQKLTPSKLLAEYEKLKPAMDKLSPGEKIGTLRQLQREMNSRITNFKLVGDPTEGLLKSTAKEIAQDIKATPGGEELRAVQAKYARSRKLYNDLQGLLKDEGKAEQTLENVFKSDSPKWKTIRSGLAALEKISGKPVLTDLYQQFAAKYLNKAVGRPTIASLITASSFFNPKAAALLAAQSPKVISRVVPFGIKSSGALTGVPLSKALSDQSRAEVEKIKARLKAR